MLQIFYSYVKYSSITKNNNELIISKYVIKKKLRGYDITFGGVWHIFNNLAVNPNRDGS